MEKLLAHPEYFTIATFSHDFVITYRFVKEVNQLHISEQFVPGHREAMELAHLHVELSHSLSEKSKTSHRSKQISLKYSNAIS